MIKAGMPWVALAPMEPHRCYQLAWFIYGWIEREHLLNVNSCTNWWMQAIGSSASQRGPTRSVSQSVSRRSGCRS